MIYFFKIFALGVYRMKKLMRSDRLVRLAQYLTNNPHKIITLSHFTEIYNSAKSTISEDLDIINNIFQEEKIGELVTYNGASGGVKFIPLISNIEAMNTIQDICNDLSKGERLLPGGYLYMLDILGNPKLLSQIGRIFATAFAKEIIDTIITVETKGIPIAYATARYLNVPVVVVRRDSKVTEGSVVTINYISGSSRRIQTMSLARRAMKEGSNVLIIDDFMKVGGTVNGMVDLLQEFNANIKGIGVLVEVDKAEERIIESYISLARLVEINEREKKVVVKLGNFFKEE